MGSLSPHDQIPLTLILIVEIFYVWGINFMGPFPPSYYFHYIVDDVSKWVEVKATRTDNSKTVADFVRSYIFYRYGISRAIISDRGTHFCNWTIEALFRKYGVTHRTFIAYHPQTKVQAKVSNKEIKSILEKNSESN